MISFKVDNLKRMSAELAAFCRYLQENSVSDDDVFLSRLVSCELITNVIRHSGETAEFTAELTEDGIGITVTAESFIMLPPESPPPDVFAENGRGLYIVRSVICGDIQRGPDGGLKVFIKRHN